MNLVKSNAITVPPERMEEFAERFAQRPGRSADRAQHRSSDPVVTASEIWPFDVLD